MRKKPMLSVEAEARIAALELVIAVLAEQLAQARERALRERHKFEMVEAERDELRKVLKTELIEQGGNDARAIAP